MAIPARPIAGALLDAAWGGLVHDTVVAQDVQGGSFTTVHTASATSAPVNVTFPRAFAAPPVVVFGSGNYNYVCSYSGAVATATGFQAGTYRASGVNPTANIPCQWLAYGPRA